MRFFHRFKGLNTQFFGLVDNIMLSAKPLTEYTRTIEYLSKYSYVLDNVKKIETSDKYPNKIWQLWLQGENNMPPIVKSCTNSVKYYHPDEVVMLTADNLKDYIDLPDYIVEKHKKGIITYANLSDIIRTMLLSKYGGCWVDSTIYLTGRIPDDILNADFFAFSTYDSWIYNNVYCLEDFKMYCNYLRKPISVESSFFIRSNPGGNIVNRVFSLFAEYWKYENSIVDYLMIDRFFNMVLIHDPALKSQFLKMPKYYISDVSLLHEALFEHFDSEIFKTIKRGSNVHKLTHKNIKRNPYNDSFLKYLENTPVNKV